MRAAPSLESSLGWPWNEIAEEPYPCGETTPPGEIQTVRPVDWATCLASLPTCAVASYPYCFNESLACAEVTVRFPEIPIEEGQDITWTGDRFEYVDFEFRVVLGVCQIQTYAMVVTRWTWNATAGQAGSLPACIETFCTVRRAGFGPYQSVTWDPFCTGEQPCIPCGAGTAFSASSTAATVGAPCVEDMTIDCANGLIYGTNDYTGVSFIIECTQIPKPTGP